MGSVITEHGYEHQYSTGWEVKAEVAYCHMGSKTECECLKNGGDPEVQRKSGVSVLGLPHVNILRNSR